MIGLPIAALVALLAAVAGSGGDSDASGGGPTSTTATAVPTGFLEVADARLRAQGTDLATACDRTDPVRDRLLREYGALFVAADGVRLPGACLMDEVATVALQTGVPVRALALAGFTVRLQTSAADALEAAVADAAAHGGTIAPKAADAAERAYPATAELWRERVASGLLHWRRAGRLPGAEVDRIEGLPVHEQVAEVLRLEGTGLLFGTREHGPILSSVAAPGSSQHLSLLAFDVRDHDDPAVLAALAAHGWFRTVRGDAPHLTYLGLAEAQLPARGLRQEQVEGRTYWVPDLP